MECFRLFGPTPNQHLPWRLLLLLAIIVDGFSLWLYMAFKCLCVIFVRITVVDCVLSNHSIQFCYDFRNLISFFHKNEEVVISIVWHTHFELSTIEYFKFSIQPGKFSFSDRKNFWAKEQLTKHTNEINNY